MSVYWAVQAGLLTSFTFARHRLGDEPKEHVMNMSRTRHEHRRMGIRETESEQLVKLR